MCWSSGSDPAGNDLTTKAGAEAHSKQCLLNAPCQNSGFVLTEADDAGVVTKYMDVYSGECSDNNKATFAACNGSEDIWTHSDEQKALVQMLTATECTDNIQVKVR